MAILSHKQTCYCYNSYSSMYNCKKTEIIKLTVNSATLSHVQCQPTYDLNGSAGRVVATNRRHPTPVGANISVAYRCDPETSILFDLTPSVTRTDCLVVVVPHPGDVHQCIMTHFTLQCLRRTFDDGCIHWRLCYGGSHYQQSVNKYQFHQDIWYI